MTNDVTSREFDLLSARVSEISQRIADIDEHGTRDSASLAATVAHLSAQFDRHQELHVSTSQTLQRVIVGVVLQLIGSIGLLWHTFIR